jgi:nucleoside-diphosphate-sugar epimerase
VGDITRKTVMVTGAGGFLGKNLIAELVSRNHTVYAVTSKSEEELGVNGLSAVVPNRDFKAIARLLDETDVLVNCAFPRNVDGYKLAEGMDYLQELFAVAGGSQVGAVVNISSQSVYSQTRTETAREDTPVCLESTYAVAKYASEQLLEAYCSNKPHTNIRLASLIGPGFDQRVVNKMVKKALAGEELLVLENGSRFAYLDVADAVSGLLALCGSDSSKWLRAYNLGPDGCVTLTEIANLVLHEVNASNGEAGGARIKTSENTPTSSELDSSLFENSFGWVPVVGLGDSIHAIAKQLMGTCTKAFLVRKPGGAYCESD